MKFFRSKKVKVIAMLLVVAIIGGVVYNTGVTKKSKASEINGNQISISEEIDYSMIDENIKDIDVTNNVDGSVEAVVYYVDGTREVAVADKVNNTVKTEVYNKDNTLKTCEVTNLDLGECVATELNEQDTLNEDDEASVKRNNSEITRGKKKLPAPKEKGNKLIWKLNANQVQVFIAMCNVAGALATLVAA